MRRSLRYEDAVKVLAGGESQLVKVLDDVSSVMLFGSGVFDLFEAKKEALRLADRLLQKFGEKLRGVDLLTRTERIEAAHHLVRITAYFDAFAATMAEVTRTGMPQFSASEQAAMATGVPSDAGWRDLFQTLRQSNNVSSIFDADPLPIFGLLSEHLGVRLQRLAIWDALNATERDRLMEQLYRQVPAVAATRYQEYLRRLAVDCPEFQVWLHLEAHAATRHQVATGLAGLEQLLAPLVAGQQESLNRAHRAALTKPIVLGSGPESGLALPSLGEGYVNHRYHFALPGPEKADLQTFVSRNDLPEALSAFLLSDDSRTAPLLILGQPGSGKSVLTRILAARLPAQRFLPIRVELRHVNADGDVQDHIESAIRDQTGEHAQWTRFVKANPDVLPVVILDGFDELLQATGVTQTDFLLRIERFQEREIDLGRAVAVIVTTRTAVAHRAAIPNASRVIELEPFDDEQIAAWIDIWNRTNGTQLVERGVEPLSADAIARYPVLAEQPLLLLMLAIYDATDNALSAINPDLDQSTIYEQLLQAFARRELMKDPDIGDLDRRVEHELLRLSIVAFAMFNRGTQWIDDGSLTEDLRTLGIWETPRNPRTLRSTLSAGQQIVGRFFFVHDSRATRDGRELQTYEFLHATFSEYLIARLINRLLVELAEQHIASARSLTRSINDGLLYALLSFDCLAARAPVIEFIGALLSRLGPPLRNAINEVLLSLFQDSLYERTDRAYADYQPVSLDTVQRASRWNANLFTLMAFDTNGVSMRSLYPHKGDGAVDEWHRLANLWRSSVRRESWNSLADSLSVERKWVNDGRDIVIRVGKLALPPTAPDLSWTYYTPEREWRDGSGWDSHLPMMLQQRANFLWYPWLDLAIHNTLSITAELPKLANTVYHTSDGRLVTATSLLLSAFIAPHVAESADAAILDLANALARLSTDVPRDERVRFFTLAFGAFITAVELDRVSEETRRVLKRVRPPDKLLSAPDVEFATRLGRLIQLLAIKHTPPSPEASSPPSPSPTTSSPETPATPPAAP